LNCFSVSIGSNSPYDGPRRFMTETAARRPHGPPNARRLRPRRLRPPLRTLGRRPRIAHPGDALRRAARGRLGARSERRPALAVGRPALRGPRDGGRSRPPRDRAVLRRAGRAPRSDRTRGAVRRRRGVFGPDVPRLRAGRPPRRRLRSGGRARRLRRPRGRRLPPGVARRRPRRQGRLRPPSGRDRRGAAVARSRTRDCASADRERRRARATAAPPGTAVASRPPRPSGDCATSSGWGCRARRWGRSSAACSS